MVKIELSNYNLSELRGLQKEVEKEIIGHQQQDLRKAREQILAIAQEAGISIEDLLDKLPNKTKTLKRQVVRPQYQNPVNSAQTWTGRGRQPKWIAEGLENGKVLDDFRI